MSTIVPGWPGAAAAPPNLTVCTAVPSPDTPSSAGVAVAAAAAAPPASVIAPYTAPVCAAGLSSGALYAMRTVFGPANTALAVAAAAAPPAPCRDMPPAWPSEPGRPGEGSASPAALPASSATAPPLSDSAVRLA